MGIFDKAKDLIGDHEEAIKDGVDKAADVVADKVGEGHADKVEQGAEKLKDVIDGLAD
jgi:hypothetical protein